MATAPFSIRRCAPDEAPVIAALGARLFTEAYGPTHPEPELSRYLGRSFAVATWAAAMRQAGVAVLLVEDAERVPIGYARIEITTPPLPAGVVGQRATEIQRFYVAAPWQGRGVADALMNACRAVAREQGADRIWLQAWQQAPRAIAFYRRAGFIITGSATFRFGDRLDDDFLMTRGP